MREFKQREDIINIAKDSFTTSLIVLLTAGPLLPELNRAAGQCLFLYGFFDEAMF
jgi:hypothetical protein